MIVVEVRINPTRQGCSIELLIAYEKIDKLPPDDIDRLAVALANTGANLASIAAHNRSKPP